MLNSTMMMVRPAPALFGRALCIGVGRVCLQNSSRFLQCQASHQYYFPSRSLISGTKLLVSNASNLIKYNNGLVRQTIQRRCTGTGGSSAGSSGGGGSSSSSSNAPPKNLSLFQRFKQMYKDYWYVMLPVHLVTSAGWFGAFYHVTASGVDLGYYLRKIGVSENVIKHITDSGMGNVAVAWALYKVATPARYAVTLGGTTVAINVLRKAGYIKPAKELMAKGMAKGRDKIQEGRDKIQAIKEQKMPKK